jgi:hypothetical protein
VVAATRIVASPERLIAWMPRLPVMPQRGYIPVVERFSSPPQIEDLERLTLADGDLDDIRDCRPGDCGLKLSGGEAPGLIGDSARGDRPVDFEQSVCAVLAVPEINRVFLSEAPCNPDRLVS